MDNQVSKKARGPFITAIFPFNAMCWYFSYVHICRSNDTTGACIAEGTESSMHGNTLAVRTRIWNSILGITMQITAIKSTISQFFEHAKTKSYGWGCH
jgi:hypothetical protein